MGQYFLVYLELRNGAIAKSSIDVWNRFQELAACIDDRIYGLAAGPAAEGAFDVLQGNGTIYHAAESRSGSASDVAVCAMLEELARRHGVTGIALASTAMGRRVAPLLSGRLRAALLSGCRAFGGPDEACSRFIHSGAVIASYMSASAITVFLQGRELASPDFCAAERPQIEIFDAAPYLDAGIDVLFRTVMHSSQGRDIAEASVIVAGGRGMGNPEAFGLLEELAALFGGSVGASRSAVDEGWRPHGEQIGQTGKRVAPDLYIACGISGALQHLAGIAAARIVVAVNSDPDAPIFGVADYGIVGDVRIVLPGLIAAVRDLLTKK
ncbi:MAG: electron transfer flavoprotein subunit alpha/FixB family protein [Chlorobium sp.]|uniref:electron transfer flavoprotein subunit alpha/FixB family protein n=1 Tax=Chlorobium sp. TaxID=1095 RepID=UPI0025BD0131|nr:electron transfer flavoprotein subunit alpha/FixB family protein [Chlorobium sp.]MCF8215347.1 electron transfer flavoprotein subunit alpha/FixB family protein [Chlorobium sp.]MCF8270185.1 electron transfer flavoprotein subunit alpha/FixB family protein [Chlorobium sp.]MCF8286554.1 electron transfer flavoprotein subunit alpha/FixB family protein [Chlorobium sp.]MCF8290153.1 electron transfer flavoprotein subunit alpha/FixB family protein [Chlorobium sp.]MCF8384312.1 electron transfer flavopr